MDYEKTLETVKQMVKDGQVSQETAERYFPELKVIKDERIRKAIHIYLDWLDGRKDCAPKGEYSIKDMIAWLDKQWSESKVKCLINEMKFYYEDNPEATWGTGKFSMKVKDILSWLEKQGQQKPAAFCREHCKGFQDTGKCFADGDCKAKREAESIDKVEPMFKVDEWIIQENIGVYKVIEVCESWYEVVDNKDKHYSIGFDKEYMCRLWTIKDAKNGSVLYSPSHHLIWIYKDNEHYHACVNMHYVTGNVITDGLISVPNDACPATRVQRSILFQKMEESNCKWDDEKKELKKIEQKPQRIISAEAKQAMYDKPVWSEEDENMLNLTLGLLSYHRQCRTWLKSLKDRVGCEANCTTTKEWSEEDEKNLQGIIAEIEANKNNAPDCDLATYDRFLSWLKSLRPQNRWKPSDEQMKVLLSEVIAWSKGCHKQIVLESLYQDLKKLKG